MNLNNLPFFIKLRSSVKFLRPERLFLVFASFFGIVFLFLTPPFQTPDEFNHFYRAYQISDGQFTAVCHNDRIGGFIPESIVTITKPYERIGWSILNKSKFDTPIEQLKIPLKESKKVFVDFPNTGVYSPVSYIPQAIGIAFLKLFNASPIVLFYGGRLFALIFWTASIFIAIKLIPIYKWLFTLLVLLPMSLSVNMSMSADVVTNSLAFLLIALIVKVAFKSEQLTRKEYFLILVLSLLLASAKLVYFPIILLFLLIPWSKSKSKKYYLIQVSILFVLSFLTVLFWTKQMNSYYLPYSEYNELYRDHVTMIDCVDMHKQKEYIVSNGDYILKVFGRSLIDSREMYLTGYIGTFGWLETKLPIWLIYFAYGIIFLVIIADRQNEIKLTILNRLIIFTVFTLMVILILLSQHLIWDCVGGEVIANLQGRYFIPAFPLLFLLFSNVKIPFVKRKFAGLINLQVFAVVFFTSFSLSYSIWILYDRYYTKLEYSENLIKCGAEKLSENNKFVTNDKDNILDNVETRTAEVVRTGNFSFKMDPNHRFSCTGRFNNFNYRDVIEVDIWRKGENGGIVLSGEENSFYQAVFNSVESDSSGWERLHLEYMIPKTMLGKETGFYLYYKGEDSVYFDDLSIKVKKVRN